jgi:perosamine synthetase
LIPIFEPLIGSEERKNLLECIDTGWISSQGEFIAKFEKNFSQWNSMSFGVATSNCTAAIHLSLVALGIGEGDEVLCPDLTFIAPANMIRWAGATPVLIDIEEPSWGINPKRIEEKITNKTKAIIVVHAFGHSADMDPIIKIARKYNLFIIEDVAEAPGAKYKGSIVGSLGDVSCYSFFANKIMTTGEGGMVLTNNSDLDQHMRIYRDHGMSHKKRYVHVVPGFNYRMTNMQAAVGVAQLQRLDEILSLRKKQSDRYKEHFLDNPRAIWRPVSDWCESVHWLSTITLRNASLRDPLLEYMKEQGVDCRQMVYPVHMARPYQDKNDPDDYPVSNSISLRSLHLPSSLSLSDNNQQKISDLIQDWLERNDF